MKTGPTYEELFAVPREQNKRKDERIAPKVPDNQPGLFDHLFEKAMNKKALEVER